MIITVNDYSLTLIREDKDPKFYGSRGAKGESNLLYYLKKELNKKGFELIKKRMWKDGHLVDDMQQFLRTTNPKSKAPHIFLYNNHWAINGLEHGWNNGKVDISISYNAFGIQCKCKEMVSNLLK